MPTTVSFYF